jgi:hypothetical protein
MNKRPPRNGEITLKIQNTLLVDGNALFKTGFFGAKGQYNQHGNHVGGIYQFLTTLRMVLDNDLYHRVYVFWDGNFSGKLRYEIYEPYKSGRGKDYKNGTQPIDESELAQREIIWEYLKEMYIRQLKHEIIEGDDFIAYYCLTKKENEKITIVAEHGNSFTIPFLKSWLHQNGLHFIFDHKVLEFSSMVWFFTQKFNLEEIFLDLLNGTPLSKNSKPDLLNMFKCLRLCRALSNGQ